jgi:hypothetical protein
MAREETRRELLRIAASGALLAVPAQYAFFPARNCRCG